MSISVKICMRNTAEDKTDVSLSVCSFALQRKKVSSVTVDALSKPDRGREVSLRYYLSYCSLLFSDCTSLAVGWSIIRRKKNTQSSILFIFPFVASVID
jgi:hypothetical protein